MSANNKLIRLILVFGVLVGIVLLYLTIKYFYYQNRVYDEIQAYNKSVKEYDKIYESIDNFSELSGKKINFYYIEDSEKFINEIELGYKELSNLIEDMRIKVVFASSNLRLIRKNQTKTSTTFHIDDKDLFIEDTTFDKRLFYSIDEIHELYEESEKSENEVINKTKKKK